MAFATAEDIATRIGRALDATEAATVAMLLDLATGAIRAAARQHISLVEDDALTVRGIRGSTLLLPERPVMSVTSITLDATALATDTYYLEHGDTLNRAAGFGTYRDALVIVYTHGYADDAIPAVIKAVCVEAVIRAFVNPGSVMSERVGSEQTTYAVQGTPAGLMLTADERRAVRHATRRGARSEALR